MGVAIAIVIPVLVLAASVVGVQNQVRLPKAVVCEVVVEERNDAVRTLPNIHPLVYEVIDLYNESECDQKGQNVSVTTTSKRRTCLPGYSLAAYAKNATFSGHQKVNWPWLLRIMWVVDLKGMEIISITISVCYTQV